MGKLIDVTCEYCGNIYERTVNRYNEAIKFGQKQFCSSDCKRLYQKTSIDVTCGQCGLNIYIKRSAYDASMSKNFFCSKRCAAIFSNKHRKISDAQKIKTSETLLKKYNNGVIPLRITRKDISIGQSKIEKNCIICNAIFYVNKCNIKQKYCSKNCYNIDRHGSIPYSKNEVIEKIKYQYSILNATPSSKLVGSKLSHAAQKYFGSQNNAIRFAGFNPNTQQMSKKRLLCKDGHLSDSVSEMIIDNWLFDHSIQHERYRMYPNSKMNCDFYLPEYDIWIEYFGLAGEHRDYDNKINDKRCNAINNNLILVEIFPKHLYPDNRLDIIVGSSIKTRGLRCG